MGLLRQPRHNKNLLYRHDKFKLTIQGRPLSFVLFEFPFSSVSTVSRGHPSLSFFLGGRFYKICYLLNEWGQNYRHSAYLLDISIRQYTRICYNYNYKMVYLQMVNEWSHQSDWHKNAFKSSAVLPMITKYKNSINSFRIFQIKTTKQFLLVRWQ